MTVTMNHPRRGYRPVRVYAGMREGGLAWEMERAKIASLLTGFSMFSGLTPPPSSQVVAQEGRDREAGATLGLSITKQVARAVPLHSQTVGPFRLSCSSAFPAVQPFLQFSLSCSSAFPAVQPFLQFSLSCSSAFPVVVFAPPR